MSEEPEDLELQALARQLDDAFQTTRPRVGFDDELWARVQTRRPLGARLRDALGGFFQGVREVPAVPLAGVAALLVVVIGVGIFAYSGVGRPTSATRSNGGAAFAPADGQSFAGDFGRLPSPVLTNNAGKTVNPQPTMAAAPADSYAGPVQLTWKGTLNLTITRAPVFRYREPTTTTADQFAAALGAVLRSRPGGLLGSYEATDYALEVRGTIQAPSASPAYFIYSSSTMPPIEAAGAGPEDVARIFLAAHSLMPSWNYAIAVDTSATPTRVVLQRQFDASGYGPAFLIDVQGSRYGMQVDVDGNRVTHVAGLLPVSIDEASYSIITADAAIRAALGTGSPVPVTTTPAPAVQLTQAELAYLLVPAGDHSFFEPVFLFSGTFQLGGKTYTKRVIVPAVDPSQRTP